MAENTVARTEQNVIATPQESTHEPDRYVTPAVDIFEEQNGLVVVADMPGLTQDAISISVEKDVLTIKGVTKEAAERGYIYREFEPVGYFRQFTLGNHINQTGIKAEYKHGVLRLVLPFAEESKPRVIDVKVA